MAIKTFEASGDCHVVVLAGGKGARLHELTAREAKPALEFGYESRLIDFSIANAVNSGLETFTVATQYRPETLYAHLHRTWMPHIEAFGGQMTIASGSESGPDGFSGTADAIRQSIDRIDYYRPRRLLVLAGDHVYRMDYRHMIDTHAASGRALTIGAIHVPIAEASSFGIIDADDGGRVRAFDEKPAIPSHAPGRIDQAIASMGIYVFEWKDLRAFLLRKDIPGTDFGHDVIPAFVSQGEAQVHWLPDQDGLPYWRDVGTLDAFHQAHFEISGANGLHPAFRRWPLHVGTLAMASRWSVAGNVLGKGAIVASASDLTRSVVMPGAIVPSGVRLNKAIVSPGTILSTGMEVGFGGEADRFFRTTPAGVTLITQQMVSAWRNSRARRLTPVLRTRFSEARS